MGTYTTNPTTAEEIKRELEDYCGDCIDDYNWEQVASDVNDMGGFDEIDSDLMTAILQKNDTTSRAYKLIWTPNCNGCVCDGSWELENRYLLLEEARLSERYNAKDYEFEAIALNAYGQVVTVYWNDVVDSAALGNALETDDWSDVFTWEYVDDVSHVQGYIEDFFRFSKCPDYNYNH